MTPEVYDFLITLLVEEIWRQHQLKEEAKPKRGNDGKFLPARSKK